ncbi:MAG: hypothetical protein ACHQ0J_06865 [Candidatus Dormibacterales bacterium]
MAVDRIKLTALAAACALAVAACASRPSAGAATAPPVAGHLKGVAFSPRAGSQGVAAFLRELPSLGGTTSWSGDWAELASPSSSPYQISALAAAQSSPLVVIVSAHRNSAPAALVRPLDEPTEAAYLSDLDQYFGKFRPNYFGLGIEINNLFESDPSGYRAFTMLFEKAAAKIHQLSPSTQVFIVFQLEKMKGLKQGLLANSSIPASGEWQLLNDFPSADLFAFTSYPFLVYHDPSQIPSGYYTDIATHTSKALAISELGWPSAGVAAGWGSTEQIQADFIDRFQSLAKGVGFRFVLWLSAYDQSSSGGATFSSIGLAQADGTQKAAWSRWEAATF